MSSINSIKTSYLDAAKQNKQNKQSISDPKRAIIFHGNCVDGIAAAYLMSLTSSGTSLYFPVSPSDKRTWPAPASLGGYEIVFVDVCFPPEDMRLYSVVAALSKQPLTIFDHHPLATLVSTSGEGIFSPTSITSTEHCATYHCWSHLYPSVPHPKWVQMLDDIDNWRNITDEHRALREIIHLIAKSAVDESPQKAMMEMAYLINDRLTTNWSSVIAEGQILLDAKIARHEALLPKCPTLITDISSTPWPLPKAWSGSIFVVNTGRDYIHDYPFDTTLASELIFKRHPEVNVFINYHESKWLDRKTKEQKRKFVYHARARDQSGIDLTLCPVLKGHSSAAGGQEEEREGVPNYFAL